MTNRINPSEMTPIRLAPLTSIKPEFLLPAAQDEEKSIHSINDDTIKTATTEFEDIEIEPSENMGDISDTALIRGTKLKHQNQQQSNVPSSSYYADVTTAPPSHNSLSDGEVNEIPVGKKLRVKPTRDGSGMCANELLVWIQIHVSAILRQLSYQNFKFALHECNKSVMVLFVDKQSWSTGMFYFAAGLAMSFISEIMNGPKYNTAMLLCVMASVYFKSFPGNSVRPQLVITFLTALSFALDIFYFTLPLTLVRNGAKALTAVAMVIKCIALYDFLWLSSGASKARKYLQRRLRVFFFPLVRPRKIMRDIRSRILALEWIQFVSGVGYLILFIAGVSAVGFSSLMTSPSRGIPLVAFFPLKCITSMIVFAAFLADTDVVLCLHHFGCLGWAMRFVKVYIHKKKDEYGGWPLPYGLNPYRFYVICGLKFVDVCWGIGGWVTIGTTFGSNFYNASDSVVAMVCGCVFMLLLSDVWCPILFYVVVNLLSVHEMDMQGQSAADVDSDDSELDDFNIRNDQKAAEAARSDSRKDRMFRHGVNMKKGLQRLESGSSSSSDESTGSDGDGDGDDEGKRRRVGRKHTRRQRVRVEDEDEESQQNHTHISLEMALGTLVDSEEETGTVVPRGGQDVTDNGSDDEAYGSPLHRGKRQQQQQTHRREDDIVSPIRARHFSPGKGDWGVASSNAERYSGHTVRGAHTERLQQQALSGGVAVENSPVISPDSYTNMWETMPTVASFDTKLFPEEDRAEFKLVEMVEHLHNESFYVVAAGQVQDVATLYGFAAGTDTFGSPVYFLFELKILMNCNIADREGYWSFECVCKCTHQELASTFVKMMLLGDVLRLAG